MVKQKKAQLEIFGLMIVIVLVMLGIFFAIKFVLLDPAPTLKQDYNRVQLSSNFGVALLQSSSDDCRGIDFSELITDCAEFQTISCDGKRSCDYINTTLDSILKDTLDLWKVKYHIVARLSSHPEPIIEKYSVDSADRQNCKNDKKTVGSLETFFLPMSHSGSDMVNFEVFICG